MTEVAPPSSSASETALSAPQLERALLTALAAGPSRLIEQVKYLLELSRKVTSTRPPAPPANPPLTPAQARVTALTHVADLLSEVQLADLYKDIQAIQDDETRLLNSAKLALLLPPQYFQNLVRTVWEQSERLTTPDARARVLLQLTPLLTLVHDEPTAPPILLEIVALSQAISNNEARIRSLMALVPHLPHSMRVRVLHRIIDEIDRLHNDSQRAIALSNLASHMMPEIETRALRSAESIQIAAERARALTGLARVLPLSLQPTLRRTALNAIGTIADEEERAEALINFAPHLEYVTETQQFPNLLEQALGVAISIKRRHLRARVLVALAPHMSADLQGEALAAVHGLSNERERTALLAQLAPTLPPNMLVPSLAVAHSMVEQDTRAHALTVLAHHVPESAHERTMLDALAAASNVAHRYERVTALLSLLDVLPPHLKARAFTDALDSARLIENENARARALSLLAPSLPPGLHLQALEITRQISNAEQRLMALGSIAKGLPSDQQHALGDELLSAIGDLPFEYKQARALGEVADLLDAQHIVTALEMARELEDTVDRTTAYTALIPHLPAEKRREITIECWQLIRGIDSGYDAASALSALAPLLPKSAANDLARTAGMIIGSIMDDYDQASAITILAPLLAGQQESGDSGPLPDKYTVLEKAIRAVLEIPDPMIRAPLLAQGAQLWVDVSEEDQCYRLWQTVIQRLSKQSLADAMLALSMLAPVARHLAGNRGLSQIAQLLLKETALTVAESQR
jgi:hypothetical protein